MMTTKRMMTTNTRVAMIVTIVLAIHAECGQCKGLLNASQTKLKDPLKHPPEGVFFYLRTHPQSLFFPKSFESFPTLD